MWKAFLSVSLMVALLASAAAQDSPEKPQAPGDAPQGKSSRRRDDFDPTAIERVTELQQKLIEKPDDKALLLQYTKSLASYVNSAVRSAQRLAGRDPAEAAKRFHLAEAAVKRIPEGIADAEAKREFERLRRNVAQTEEKLARLLKHDALIGAKAAPLQVEHWASGTPLADSDLKGKVVVLDFFAVWCRPCIETFPELARWREKYGDKGLVIVGLTKYYNYQWDERTEGPREASGTVTVAPPAEREMLQKFAKLHELKHSLALQPSAEFLDYYGVTAVPQMVIIDREGIVRFVGAGDQSENLPEISALLDKLVGELATGEPKTGDAANGSPTNPR